MSSAQWQSKAVRHFVDFIIFKFSADNCIHWWPATEVCHRLEINYCLKHFSLYHIERQLKTMATCFNIFFFLTTERSKKQMACHKLGDTSKLVVGPGSAESHLPQDDKDSQDQTAVIKSSPFKTSASTPGGDFNPDSSYTGKDSEITGMWFWLLIPNLYSS